MNIEAIERIELERITKLLESKGLTVEQLHKHTQDQAEKENIGFTHSDEVTEIRIEKHKSIPVAPVEEEVPITKLCNGQVFKNYKELCILMGWKIYSGGRAKKLQWEELGRMCKYHKQGNRIVIDEVYQYELDKVDKRRENRGNGRISTFYNEFETLMLLLLNEAPSDQLEFTITQLMLMAGFVNDDYRKYKYQKALLSKEIQEVNNIEIDSMLINKFYEVFQNGFSKTARGTLRTMERRFLINVEEITMIRTFERVKSPISGKMKKVYNQDRKATKEEIKILLAEKRKLMELLECKNINELYKKSLANRFYIELKAILEEKYNISFDYKSYRATLNKEALTKEVEELVEVVTVEELMEAINNKALDKGNKDYNVKVLNQVNGFKESNQEILKQLSNTLIAI